MIEDDAIEEVGKLVSKMYLEGKFSSASSNRELTPVAAKIIENKIQHMEMTAEKIPSDYNELKDFVIHMVRKVGNPTGVVSFDERGLELFLETFVKSLGLPIEEKPQNGDDNDDDED